MKVACDKCLKVDDADKKRDWLIYRAYPSGKAYLNYGLDAIWKKKLKNLRYDIIEKAVDRLAAYEDSNLTPAEVAELAQAKADGRLVVLPCKRGDMVYFIGINYTKCSAYGTEYDEVCCAGCEEPCDSEKTRNVYMTQAEDTRWILRRLNDFGRIYFITREEAEKALRESDNNA